MSTARPATASMSVDVSAHVYPETAIDVRAYAVEDRATVRLTGGLGSGVDVTLFADRTQLVRLHEALGALVVELNEERTALAQSLRANESAA